MTRAVVTETDQAVEKFIMAKINQSYPTHCFIGEESFAGGSKVDLTDAPTWIIDPIDGTTNFTRKSHILLALASAQASPLRCNWLLTLASASASQTSSIR